jgi:hypothetical protein
MWLHIPLLKCFHTKLSGLTIPSFVYHINVGTSDLPLFHTYNVSLVLLFVLLWHCICSLNVQRALFVTMRRIYDSRNRYSCCLLYNTVASCKIKKVAYFSCKVPSCIYFGFVMDLSCIRTEAMRFKFSFLTYGWMAGMADIVCFSFPSFKIVTSEDWLILFKKSTFL